MRSHVQKAEPHAWLPTLGTAVLAGTVSLGWARQGARGTGSVLVSGPEWSS